MSENLTTWVVVRTHYNPQTSETLVLAFMKSFVGTDPEAVKRAATDYENELTAAGDGEWLAGLPDYERASTVVSFEAQQVTDTERLR